MTSKCIKAAVIIKGTASSTGKGIAFTGCTIRAAIGTSKGIVIATNVKLAATLANKSIRTASIKDAALAAKKGIEVTCDVIGAALKADKGI